MTYAKFAGLGALALAACATAGAEESEMSAEAAEKLAGFTRTGDKVNCLNLRSISEIEPLSEELFLLRVGASTFYLSEMKGRCGNADSAFSRLQYRTSLSQLCRNEIVNVVDNSTGMTQGGCAFGDFEKLEKKAESPKS